MANLFLTIKLQGTEWGHGPSENDYKALAKLIEKALMDGPPEKRLMGHRGASIQLRGYDPLVKGFAVMSSGEHLMSIGVGADRVELCPMPECFGELQEIPDNLPHSQDSECAKKAHFWCEQCKGVFALSRGNQPVKPCKEVPRAEFETKRVLQPIES